MNWQRSGMDLKLLNYISADYSNPGYILNESLLDHISKWCRDSMPAVRRMSFDTFRFRQEKDITAFLLRWS
jgi:hypothetical protein